MYTMLEKLFTSNTRTKILGVLLFEENGMYLREISREIGGVASYVKKELDNLISLGILVVKRQGNVNVYSLDKECSFIPELRGIFLKTDFIGEEIKGKLRGEKYVFIYGSYAKGTFEANSDIDLMVIGGIKEVKLMKIVNSLERRLGREINYILWGLDEFEEKKTSALIKTIKANKIMMLVGDENEFREEI